MYCRQRATYTFMSRFHQAYNLFFKHSREEILSSISDVCVIDDGLTEEMRRRRHRKTHGKIGFAELARNIAEKWKNIDIESKAFFEAKADAEKVRYRKELEIWNQSRKAQGLSTSSSPFKKAKVSARQQESLKSMLLPALTSQQQNSPSQEVVQNQLLQQQMLVQQAFMNQQRMEAILLQEQQQQQQQMELIMSMNAMQQQRTPSMQSPEFQQQIMTPSFQPLPPPQSVPAVVEVVCEPQAAAEEDIDVAPDMTFSSKNFFDDIEKEMEKVSTESDDDDRSSSSSSALGDDLANFMDDFECE